MENIGIAIIGVLVALVLMALGGAFCIILLFRRNEGSTGYRHENPFMHPNPKLFRGDGPPPGGNVSTNGDQYLNHVTGKRYVKKSGRWVML